MNRPDFVLRLLRALAGVPVLEQIPEASWPLVVAHAAYESGWACTCQACEGRNYFNVSAGASWRGRTLAGGDLEYSGGQARRITQQWRWYSSDVEAVRDYLALLQLRRYRPAREALVSGDAESFVRLLGPDHAGERPPVGGYYTLPAAQYLRAFLAVLAEVRAALPAEMPIA